MKKIKVKYNLLLILVLLSLSYNSIAQNELIKTEREEVNLFTDRNLYIAGEDLNFFAIINSTENDLKQKSKILYIDIITDGDKKINQNKFSISDGQVNGTLLIPDNCITGYYYLRAYTKSMRNYSHSNFAYSLLKIINPNKENFLHPKNIFAQTIDSNQILIAETENRILLNTDKKVYKYRDTIHLSIQSSEEVKNLNVFCISVAPKFSLNNSRVGVPSFYTPSQKIYNAETEGISISGQLIDKNTSNPLIYSGVYLSQLSDKNMIPCHTDSSGRFCFNLRHQYGRKKIIFTSEIKIVDNKPFFLLDNDFEKVPDDISFPDFVINKQERETAYKMAVNQQLKNVYYDKSEYSHDTAYKQAAFYFKPDRIVNFKNYISLNSLSDYFTEIDLPAKIVKKNKKLGFQVKGTQAELFIYEPLLMLDWVVVQDAEDILALSPQSISSVEIINSAYLRGEFIFGGIINFISKNNDFGGIEFRSSTIAIEYDFLSKLNQKSVIQTSNKKLPDVRNTLFWECFTSNNKQTKFDIIAGDIPENYLIVLKGIDKNGNQIQSTAEFEVK